jgi:hypothetical protein
VRPSSVTRSLPPRVVGIVVELGPVPEMPADWWLQPDPLGDARDAAIEALMNADDATKLRAVVRALLAATEGGAS